MKLNISKLNGIQGTIAIYPGRFQPMGKHHYEVYKWMKEEFGEDRSFVVTSNKVEEDRSPFNFEEKCTIMEQFGVNPNNIIQVKRPHSPRELTDRYNPRTTAAIYVLGAKDYSRFKFEKKDGTPTYFQPYKENMMLESIEKHSYIMLAPHFQFEISHTGEEMCGTSIRNALSLGYREVFEDIMGWYDEGVAEMVFGKLKKKKESRFLSFVGSLNEANSTGGAWAEVDDGPRIFIGNQKTYQKQSNDIANKLGFEVLDWILNPEYEFEVFHETEPPNGPYEPSYFAKGILGNEKLGRNTLSALRKKPEFNQWASGLEKLAGQLGMQFLNFE
jgi:phosphopantetheine adenylyltransferase